MDEERIERALEAGLGSLKATPDLLERIHRSAELLDQGSPVATVSAILQGLFRRTLHVSIACLLLLGLVGIGTLRNLGSEPGAQAPGPSSPSAAAPSPTAQFYSGVTNDPTIKIQVSLERTGSNWRLYAQIWNKSDQPVELLYECDHIVGLNLRQSNEGCQPLPNLTLAPYSKVKEERLLPDAGQGPPKRLYLSYRARTETNPEMLPVHQGVSIREGDCCVGVPWSIPGIIDFFKEGGMTARLSDQPLPVELQLKEAVKTTVMTVDGQVTVVYEFETSTDAEFARLTLATELLRTRGATALPWTYQRGRLLLRIDHVGKELGEKLMRFQMAK